MHRPNANALLRRKFLDGRKRENERRGEIAVIDDQLCSQTILGFAVPILHIRPVVLLPVQVTGNGMGGQNPKP